jgi:hypothetical protein
MRSLSRRDFLKMLGSFTAGMTLQSRWNVNGNSKGIPVPPTIMLHSKDRWKLRNTLVWLDDHGYNGITYQYFAAVLRGEATLPTKAIILTIDDVGTHYIQPDFMAMIDTVTRSGWVGVLGVVTRKTPKENPATWDVLRELVVRGWELDTHTSHHYVLPQIKFEVILRAEIVDSARMLQDGLDQAPSTLVVPFGALRDYERGGYDERIFSVSADANLDFVVGLNHGRFINTDMPPYYVGRVGLAANPIQTENWVKDFYTDAPWQLDLSDEGT